MELRTFASLLILIPLVISLGCNVQSRYQTRTFMSEEQNTAIDEMYKPPEPEEQVTETAEVDPFLKDYRDMPAIRINGLEIKASDIQKLYEYMVSTGVDSSTAKRNACSQWIQTYAVMSQWPDTIETARARLEQIRQQVLDGTDFTNLVVENSQEPGADERAGDLGTIHRGMMVPIFEMHAFTDPVNQPSEPFPTVFGWHISMPVERNTDDPDDPTVNVRHLLLAHGLDPANLDEISKDSMAAVQRWTGYANVELLVEDLQEVLPSYPLVTE
jgi:hypothetical protein